MSFFSILFEDSDIIVINKPSGVAVQGGRGISHSLDEELSKTLGYKVYLVHRLDMDTAGILVVAKSSRAAATWSSLMSSGSVKKEYTALCIGRSKDKETLHGEVIAHGRSQDALLFYELKKSGIIQVVKEDSCAEDVPVSFLKVTLGTGRMHQIRIQLAKEGLPIIADDKHGNFKINKMLKKIGIKKLCLASTKLTVNINGRKKIFEISLPPHTEEVINKMEE